MTAKLESLQPVLMVHDVVASLRFYERLGFVEAFRDDPHAPRYAGARRDGVELHFQWHDASAFASGDRPTYRFVVSNVDELWTELSACGLALERTEVRDTPWGTREFHVRDADRNGLQFYQRR